MLYFIYMCENNVHVFVNYCVDVNRQCDICKYIVCTCKKKKEKRKEKNKCVISNPCYIYPPYIYIYVLYSASLAVQYS